ncbi:MAG: glutamine amidotransferase [Nitrososphaeria archaeon]|nr:glutamine amidotransferase [Nitrosopumilaceae archaeon]NIP09485.1 glutamine amidotransferase [Nitrosopumilaceae archaeon]NIP91340.1 glutamine amidotransferase [Nitrososphaeria archaeon]NIS94350.1 glutamine amidotransferase [Nitrosopumilaceae archaeon]
MILVIDNGSIYTQNLIDFLEEKNISFEKKTPFELELDLLENYDSFILSGRRKNEKQINLINSKIVTHSIQNDKKLLGICYGAEILSLTLGGTIRKMKSLQKGDEKIVINKKNTLTDKDLIAFESHGFEISKLPDNLISLANSKSCKNEIIQYDGKLIFGTQFHPEMTSDGKILIHKFCML